MRGDESGASSRRRKNAPEVPGGLSPSAPPADIEPMLCTLVTAPVDDPAWIYEPKYDGLRVLVRFDGRKLTLVSRNGKVQNLQFPDVADALRASLARPAILDGEVVCLDAEGRSSFRALQQRFHLEDPAVIRARAEAHPAFIYLFDLLYLDRFDVRGVPLSTRKSLLRDAVRWSDRVRWTEFTRGDGSRLLDAACRRSEEGIVGKRSESPYLPGRSDAWVKVKCIGRQEFVIGGWTTPQRSRVGLGALLVGTYEDGDHLRYAGKVGTGYTRDVLLDLRRRLDDLSRPTSPFEGGGPFGVGEVHWVRPELVGEVAFAEWTQNGLLRQPRFEGLRPDKSPHECRREQALPGPATARRAGVAPCLPSPSSGDPAMSLDKYRSMRDFGKTREPSGEAATPQHERPIFVVQEHHASHLHYDFRLETDGVLKSWSVPKGPSLDPSVKRLAVQVEDHPIGYASFQGEIPEGEYGAGTVRIWDRGTYESVSDLPAAQAIEAGRLEFVMHGERLQGKFALVRMKARGRGKPQWLLMKSRDEHAAIESDGTEPARPRSRPTRPKAPSTVKTGAKGKAALTHPERIMFPEAGLTKKDVFAYYKRIADRLLPFLKDRPVTLERLPEGLTGEDAPHFWQKDTPDYYPEWIPRIELETERGKPVHYALVNDVETLLYLVNQGALTFHVWASRVGHLERPDFVLFDLDPGKAPLARVVEVAKSIKSALDEEGIRSFVKTSGKTGLHVLMPWKREGGYDEARAWALEVSERVAGELSDRATTEIRKAKRGNRVYIDVMQNAEGHHAVPPYVLRSIPRASISTPLNWKELTHELDPAAYTPKTIFRRLSRQARDPLAGLLPKTRPRPKGTKTV